MNLRSIITCVAVVSLLIACEEEDAMPLDGYDEQELLDARKTKDEQFRSEDSPLLPQERDGFKGLSYFEPNEDYAVDAVLTRAVRADTISMQTTSSELRRAVRIGSFAFEIQGNTLSLNAYQFIDGSADSYFVPFTDKTNGEQTYKAGRYLDVEVLDNDSAYVIDFNAAYQPYCAYNENFSCPIAPRENSLAVAIKAGEKKQP